MVTSASGSRAYPRVSAIGCPSDNAHFMKSFMTLACSLFSGFSYRSIQVNDEIGYAP